MNGDELGLDLDLDEPPVARAWQPHPWWAWHLGAVLLGLLALLGGGALLAGAEFGTSLRARGCDASPLGGLALLVVGGGFVTVGAQLARLQHPGAVVGIEWRSAAFALPLPVLLFAATVPGLLGCALGADIADLGLVGDALVGAPGITLAGAGAALVGAAVGSAVHVTWQAPIVGELDEPPGIVELAIEEAEARRQDAAAQRFHGVDSGD